MERAPAACEVSQTTSLLFAIPLAAQLSVWGRSSSLAMRRSVAREDMPSVQQVPSLLGSTTTVRLITAVPYQEATDVDVMATGVVATCEITSELWGPCRCRSCGAVLLARPVNPQHPMFTTQKQVRSCTFHICERQTPSEEHLGPSKPVASFLCNRWMPPPCSQKYAVVVLGVCVRLRADWIGTLTSDRSTSSAYPRYVRHLWSKIKTAHHRNDSVILASPTSTCRCKSMSSRTCVCGSTEHRLPH